MRALGALLLAGLVGCGEAPGSAVGDAGSARPPAACDSPGRQRSVVLTGFLFTRADPMRPTVVDGFDLDGRVSTAGDIEGCRQADYTSPAGTPGIDNQIARLLPVVDSMTGGALDGLIQAAVNNGQLLVAITLDGVDDLRNDDCVTFHLQRVAGMPFVGSDMRIDPGQSFDLQRDQPVTTAPGRIREGVLEVGPATLRLPVTALDARFVLTLNRGRLRATVRDDGSMTGVVAGGVSVAEFSETIRGLTISRNEMAAFTGALRLFADLAPDEAGACTQISMGLSFSARPAFVNP